MQAHRNIVLFWFILFATQRSLLSARHFGVSADVQTIYFKRGWNQERFQLDVEHMALIAVSVRN